MKTVALISLGCAKNLVDSEGLIARLKALDFALSDDLAQADMILINTCGFVQDAQQESIDHILAAAEARKPEARLFVSGCLAERFTAELQTDMPEIDALVPISDYGRLEELVRHHFPDVGPGGPAVTTRLTPPHLAYLKIAEGCDNHCTFCAIPLIRGPHRSRPAEEIITEARTMAEAGVREISLVSQHLDYYGVDRDGRPALAELLRELSPAVGDTWLRLHYCYLDHCDDALLDTIAGLDNVLHYLDIPIQHASDPVLRRMGRQTCAERIRERLATIRARLDSVVLRTSLLVGFPGETEDDLARLLDFISEQRFDQLGCFAYSSEDGTPAATMDGHLPPEVIAERHDRVMRTQAAIHDTRLASWIGRQVTVLVDGPGPEPQLLATRHYGQAFEVDNCTLVSGARAGAGDRLQVTITGGDGYDLVAEAIM